MFSEDKKDTTKSTKNHKIVIENSVTKVYNTNMYTNFPTSVVCIYVYYTYIHTDTYI